jgi:hypothetical protein
MFSIENHNDASFLVVEVDTVRFFMRGSKSDAQQTFLASEQVRLSQMAKHELLEELFSHEAVNTSPYPEEYSAFDPEPSSEEVTTYKIFCLDSELDPMSQGDGRRIKYSVDVKGLVDEDSTISIEFKLDFPNVALWAPTVHPYRWLVPLLQFLENCDDAVEVVRFIQTSPVSKMDDFEIYMLHGNDISQGSVFRTAVDFSLLDIFASGAQMVEIDRACHYGEMEAQDWMHSNFEAITQTDLGRTALFAADLGL